VYWQQVAATAAVQAGLPLAVWLAGRADIGGGGAMLHYEWRAGVVLQQYCKQCGCGRERLVQLNRLFRLCSDALCLLTAAAAAGAGEAAAAQHPGCWRIHRPTE
jgi:hypothetical protein